MSTQLRLTVLQYCSLSGLQMKQMKTNGEIPRVTSAMDLTPLNYWTECHKEIQAFHFLMHSTTGCPSCLSGHRTNLAYAPTDLTLLPTTEIYAAGVKEFIIPTDGTAGFQTARNLYPRAEVDVRKWVAQKSTAWYEKKGKGKGQRRWESRQRRESRKEGETGMGEKRNKLLKGHDMRHCRI